MNEASTASVTSLFACCIRGSMKLWHHRTKRPEVVHLCMWQVVQGGSHSSGVSPWIFLVEVPCEIGEAGSDIDTQILPVKACGPREVDGHVGVIDCVRIGTHVRISQVYGDAAPEHPSLRKPIRQHD